MSIFNTVAVAAAAAPSGGGDAGAGAGGASFLILIVVMFVAMYFMMFRPQQKRQKAHKAMIEGMTKGNEVITSGGIVGHITALGDQFVTVEIADGVKIRLQRASISQVLPRGSLKVS